MLFQSPMKSFLILSLECSEKESSFVDCDISSKVKGCVNWVFFRQLKDLRFLRFSNEACKTVYLCGSFGLSYKIKPTFRSKVLSSLWLSSLERKNWFTQSSVSRTRTRACAWVCPFKWKRIAQTHSFTVSRITAEAREWNGMETISGKASTFDHSAGNSPPLLWFFPWWFAGKVIRRDRLSLWNQQSMEPA
jgi:hypothetical protein